jgi:hypothetical protein
MVPPMSYTGSTLYRLQLILMSIRLLFPARRLAYTKAYIDSAWKRAGICPLDPGRVLRSLKVEAESPKPAIAIPVTPRTSYVSWAQTSQVLALVWGQTALAEKLRTHITLVDKGLQQAITDKEITKHLQGQFYFIFYFISIN